ncbi:MAG: acyl-CoA dehydrogenase family protein [Candidatus Delongbacteria bacterium]|nr:acyl-CoA dehydrogenase family protein [Candidatus Delongbacteria bacterium]MCG2760895.1 acyl-CoA dehydrogenase family protein [Candidatus Delongbacteria bacterium]
MTNFYRDNDDLKFHLNHPFMKRIVELRERNYKICEKEYYGKDNITPNELKPCNFEDALDNYDSVLEIVGDICGDVIAPNAESVDNDGATLVNNRVHYAKGTVENMKALRQAGLTGITQPRKYGGLNFPTAVYSMMIEMVSRGDASLMNLFGLQDIAETVKEFATDEIKAKYIPMFTSGQATGAMILTEPDAGSDLQAVQLKAHWDEKSNVWRLNGVKRFITNGNAELSLVLARTEEGTKDGRGLSMLLYERDDTVIIRRIENKMGIHGSPTCEMIFKNSPALLIGKRKFGLIKYVMSLMNGARLGVSGQAIGLSEAAYREALKYAQERAQFGKKINQFAPVYEILTDMRVKIAALRTLYFETSRFVDVYKTLEEIEHERELTINEKAELKQYKRRSDFYTPLIKGLSSEASNKITYDAIQIHGGTGFTKDFPVERLYRDARITSIYEGTTQLQVVAAIKGVTSGLYAEMMDDYSSRKISYDLEFMVKDLKEMKKEYISAIETVEKHEDIEFLDFHARRLVEMAGNIIMGHLLVLDADRDDKYKLTAEVFIKKSKAENTERALMMKEMEPSFLNHYKELTKRP